MPENLLTGVQTLTKRIQLEMEAPRLNGGQVLNLGVIEEYLTHQRGAPSTGQEVPRGQSHWPLHRLANEILTNYRQWRKNKVNARLVSLSFQRVLDLVGSYRVSLLLFRLLTH